MDALALAGGESIWYCVPVDLTFDNTHKLAKEAYTSQIWLVVTEERFVVLNGTEITASFLLKDCEKIKCEHQVNSGIVTVTTKGTGADQEDNNAGDGQIICAARFSMKHIIRVSYLVRGAQAIISALQKGADPTKAERVTSIEYEKYCEKCGRALPAPVNALTAKENLIS